MARSESIGLFFRKVPYVIKKEEKDMALPFKRNTKKKRMFIVYKALRVSRLGRCDW